MWFKIEYATKHLNLDTMVAFQVSDAKEKMLYKIRHCLNVAIKYDNVSVNKEKQIMSCVDDRWLK